MRHRTSLVLALTLASLVVACGGGGTGPLPDGKKPLVDPFATIFVENLITPAVGARARTYDLYMSLADTSLGGHLSTNGSAGPGEKACMSMSGFVGLRTLEVVALTDTLAELGLMPRATRDSAALNRTSWTGAYRMTTGVFDPLVSADTSRGHTPARPVKWRWTLTDAGNTLVEDSTTICVY